MSQERQNRNIFLSCVTNEFGPHRELLKRDMSLPGVTVQEQADFPEGGGTLLEKLDDYIRHCDAIVHLVGDQTGRAARAAELKWLLATYPDFARRFPFLHDELTSDTPTLSFPHQRLQEFAP